MGSYKPCEFDRKEYLDNAEEYEAVALHDVTQELSEFNDDPEDLAYELSYMRYALAKKEDEVKQLQGKKARLEMDINGLRCALGPAEEIISRIEALIPSWQSYRDLPEAVEMALHRQNV